MTGTNFNYNSNNPVDLANLAAVDEAITSRVAENVASIATPASATAEDCATKINAVLTALKAAGLMANS